MNTETRLREAIETAEILKIIYHGGSCPGAMRDIAPITLKNGQLRARCYQSGSVKTFMLAKIELVDNPENRPTPEWQVSHEVKYLGLDSLLLAQKAYLESLGWIISHENESLSLLHIYGYFKNGKPKKAVVLVSIDYHATSHYCIFQGDGSIIEGERSIEKPWCVRGKGQGTRNYKHLDRAIETFLSWAELLAPARNAVLAASN